MKIYQNYLYRQEILKQQQKLVKLKSLQEKDLEQARSIHQNSIPKQLPQPNNYSIAACFSPAQHLGGDYYNFFKVEHGSLNIFFDQYFFYMFDVSGHRIDSAFLAMFVNEAIENYFKLHHNEGEKVSPAEILKYIDEQYRSANYAEDYTISIIAGVLELKNNTFTYAATGFHFPFYLLDENNNLKEIETGGLPISTTFDVELLKLRDHKINFAENSSLFICTDGLVDEKRKDKLFADVLPEKIIEHSQLPAPFLVSKIKEEFINFIDGQSPEDDITFAAIDRINGQTIDWQSKVTCEILEKSNNEIQKRLENELKLNTKLKQKLLEALLKLLSRALKTTNQFDSKQEIRLRIIHQPEQYLYLSLIDQKTAFHLNKELNFCSSKEEQKLALENSFFELISYNNAGAQIFALKFL
ncbi:SpoIIE family protein phosphatase [Fuchsiella alkaliacetigena]|nr:SpoIIE family protein phosphatase [Fuchsiella alkaliacetigena]